MPAPPEAAEAPPQWVAFAESIEWLAIDGTTVRHTRPGQGVDVARGVQHIKDGKWRIEYRVNRAASKSGSGIILGVSDVEAAAWSQKPVEPEGEDDKKKKDAKKDKKKGAADDGPPKFKPTKPAVAWGLCLSSGRLITTHSPKVGRFAGASVGEPIVERGGSADGVTVVAVCDMGTSSTSDNDAVIARHDFRAGLHPLEAPRIYPEHLKSMATRSIYQLTRPATLSFSVNGGEMQTTSIHLPEAGVYPWLLVTGQGDDVTLVSVTQI